MEAGHSEQVEARAWKILMEFRGTVLFDAEKPDGQPRRMLDTTRAYKEFSFKAKPVALKEGLEKTINGTATSTQNSKYR